MKIGYISPSILPSRSANSIHVIQQCSAFQDIGIEVDLFAVRTSIFSRNLRAKIEESYGVKLKLLNINTIFWPASRLVIPILGAYATLSILLFRRFDAVVSRNALASYIPLLFSEIEACY